MIFITITSHPDNLNLRGTFQYRTGLNAPAIASGQLKDLGYVECGADSSAHYHVRIKTSF